MLFGPPAFASPAIAALGFDGILLLGCCSSSSALVLVPCLHALAARLAHLPLDTLFVCVCHVCSLSSDLLIITVAVQLLSIYSEKAWYLFILVRWCLLVGGWLVCPLVLPCPCFDHRRCRQHDSSWPFHPQDPVLSLVDVVLAWPATLAVVCVSFAIHLSTRFLATACISSAVSSLHG